MRQIKDHAAIGADDRQRVVAQPAMGPPQLGQRLARRRAMSQLTMIGALRSAAQFGLCRRVEQRAQRVWRSRGAWASSRSAAGLSLAGVPGRRRQLAGELRRPAVSRPQAWAGEVFRSPCCRASRGRAGRSSRAVLSVLQRPVAGLTQRQRHAGCSHACRAGRPANVPRWSRAQASIR